MRFETAVARVDTAVAERRLSADAARNIRVWLSQPRYAQYAPQVEQHIDQGKWKTLDDVFWTVIPFGTAGRRGRMYPIGSNAINDRTIGESAQGLADYVRANSKDKERRSCAVAYDARHRSDRFARLCAEIMAAAGLTVYFLDGHRSTPELSFTVREKGCACGIMVTASHNPPTDNAVKVYWSTGGQILPPHDAGIIARIKDVQQIERVPFAEAVATGRVVKCQNEMDQAFVDAVITQAVPGPRDVRIVYSSLHGVGVTGICPVLKADGFAQLELFGPHAEPDGDFPNVPDHVANPEDPAVFDAIISHAARTGADLVLASDPDCDRIGCAAPVTPDTQGPWRTLSGNQIGVLLADFVLSARRAAGRLSSEDYLVKTLVTTEMIRRIADGYGVQTRGDLLVGFKWIGGVIDQMGPERFVFASEEAHGYLAGSHVRDKDACVAAMLLAELAARLKAEGQTLHQRLAALFRQYGAHAEKTVSLAMPGAEGMRLTAALMQRLRASAPSALAGIGVQQMRDYLYGHVTTPGRPPRPLAGPRGDLVILDLVEPGNYVAVRPSGTEPKVKLYMFAFAAAEKITDLKITNNRLARRIAALQRDLLAFASGEKLCGPEARSLSGEVAVGSAFPPVRRF